MSLLHYLSYGGAIAAFIFVTLSLASGLLWISELIEEHSRTAKIIGQRGIYIIITLHVLLYFYDSLPLHLVLFSVVCHVVYLQNFTASWPFVSLASPYFLSSCALVVIDHFLWFFYFARVTQEARHRARSSYRGPKASIDAPGFADIATFFGVCVWLAPLFLFLSLSANDNALPMNLDAQNAVPSTPTVTSPPVVMAARSSLFKSLYDALPIDYLPRLRPRPKRRDTSQGIIAPPSPSPRHMSSPLPSPGMPPLRRVPSTTNLPPPMTPPPRRMSSDGSDALRAEADVFHSTTRSSSFALSTPPRRLSGTMRRVPTDGRMELRRTVSTHSTLSDDWLQ